MKVIKYILIIGIGLVLWITAPIWMIDTTYHGSHDTSQVDKEVTQQKQERNKLLKAQDKERAELEAKFGPKDTVIPSLKKHWAATYTKADEFEWLRCERIKPGNNGWIAVCQFRLKGAMRQNSYTIKYGVVSQ